MFTRNDPNAAANQGFGGYLMKLKRKPKALLSQWNNRWFSVQGSTLKWYASKESTEPSGSVDLAQVTAISEFENGTTGSYSFVIRCSQRNMLLRASSTADMEKWIRILRQQASFAQGGNGTSIVLNSNPISFDKSKRNSSLANELDRALNQLDQLESEAACKSEGPAHQGAAPMSVVINERNLSAMGMDKNPDVRSMRHIKVPSPTGTGSGSDFIRSVDSEITIGKMHVANQGYGNPSSVQHGKNVTMTDDREIAIRHKSQDAGPHDQSHNDSAILHYTDEDDEEDDAVHEFSMIQDDDDIQYIERMHLEAKNINSSGKCDYVNSASEAKRESEYRGNKSVYRK